MQISDYGESPASVSLGRCYYDGNDKNSIYLSYNGKVIFLPHWVIFKMYASALEVLRCVLCVPKYRNKLTMSLYVYVGMFHLVRRFAAVLDFEVHFFPNWISRKNVIFFFWLVSRSEQSWTICHNTFLDAHPPNKIPSSVELPAKTGF